MDYYQILGVERTATAAEIKRRYRQLALTLHPDIIRNTEHSDGPEAENFDHQFALITQAYRTLVEQNRRLHYDETILAHPNAIPQTPRVDPRDRTEWRRWTPPDQPQHVGGVTYVSTRVRQKKGNQPL